MRFLDSLRRARSRCARGIIRIRAQAHQRSAGLRRNALHCIPASLLCCSLALAACSHAPGPAVTPAFVRHGSALEIPAGSALRQRIVVKQVELRAAPHFFSVPGEVEADPAHVANMLPALAGRVVALHVDLGDNVQRGQLLAVIDSGDMAQAYSDVAKAGDALQLARKALARARGVQQAGGAAGKDVEAAQSGYVQAEAEYRRARTRLAALGGTPGAASAKPIEVRAPIGGSVTALSIAPGTFVNDPTVPMLTVTDTDKVWVTAQVPEDEIGLAAVGQQAMISVPAWPGRVFHGKVQSIGAVLNADTRRDVARIAIANVDHALKPNMFASVALAVRQPPQVFVPASALLMNNDSTTVLVEIAPWTFVRRTVRLGHDEGDEARVTSGLKAGDRVIVAGGVLLNDD